MGKARWPGEPNPIPDDPGPINPPRPTQKPANPATATTPLTLSDQGRPLPIVFGTAKVAVNLIEKFAPVQTQPDAWVALVVYPLGKIVSNGANAYECTLPGTAASSGGPTGTGSVIVDGTCNWKYLQPLPMPLFNQLFAAAVAEGQITGCLSMWWDKEKITASDLTHPGKGTTLLLGPDAGGQLLTSGVFDSIGYQHTAVLCALSTTSTNTGTQSSVPDVALEIQGVAGYALPDTSPADIVNVILTDTRRGRGWPGSRVDASITGAGAGSFRTYCDAAGFRLSMVLDTQRPVIDWLTELLTATNSASVWSGGALKVIPIGDTAIPSPVFGAVGYVPPNTAVYDLGQGDFLAPLEVMRRDDVDCFNSIPVEYTDRTQGYARVPVEDPDQIDVDKRGGLHRGSTIALAAIFPDGTAPIMLSRIFTQRSLYVRNTYRFRVSWQTGLLLEPTDIVTVTDPVMGLSLVPVRIIESSETEQGFEFMAEDYPAGVSHAGRYQPQVGDGYVGNDKLTTAIVPSSVDGVKIGVLNGVVQQGALTPTNFDNLWPNPTSENAPPAGVVPKNDGSSPEFDFRVNAGASAYSGVWVRALSPTSPGVNPNVSINIPASPGDSYYIEAQVCKASGTPGTGGVAVVEIFYLDSTGAIVSGASSAGTNSATYVLQSLSSLAPAGTVRAIIVLQGNAGSTTSSAVYYFDAIYARRQITRQLFTVDALQTSNYTESGGFATAGAKLDSVGTAVKIGPAGLLVGTYLVDELAAATLKAIGRLTSGSGASLSVDRTWYRGSDDVGTHGGSPNISTLTITPRDVDSTKTWARLDFKLQPTLATDNLDGMRYAKIILYAQPNIVGTTAGLILVDTFYVPMIDRLYQTPSNDSNTGNQSLVTHTFSSALMTKPWVAMAVTLYNVFGPSDTHCFYTPIGWTAGAALTDNGTGFPAWLTGGASGGTGTGGSGGGGCLDPRTPVLISPVQMMPLGELRAGDLVWTRPEGGGELGYHRVEAVTHTSNLRQRVSLSDGRSFTCSINHLLNVRGLWRRADSLQPGEEIQGDPGGHVSRVEYLGEGPVVQLQIPTARTYLAGDGCWHHNTLKP